MLCFIKLTNRLVWKISINSDLLFLTLIKQHLVCKLLFLVIFCRKHTILTYDVYYAKNKRLKKNAKESTQCCGIISKEANYVLSQMAIFLIILCNLKVAQLLAQANASLHLFLIVLICNKEK